MDPLTTPHKLHTHTAKELEDIQWLIESYRLLEQQTGRKYLALRDRAVIVSSDEIHNVLRTVRNINGEPRAIVHCYNVGAVPLKPNTVSAHLNVIWLQYKAFTIMIPMITEVTKA